MNHAVRKAVSFTLLIPTTVVSLLLNLLFFAVAANGAPMLHMLGLLTVVWAANISMWCVLLHTLGDKIAGSTRPISHRWRHYLALGAGLALVGYSFSDRDGFWTLPMGWVALTLIFFCALVYRNARDAA